jgi:HAD superfamily hydrolase (TIGR01544 family)
MKTLIISPKEFERKKQQIISDGSKNLHFLVDFDRTLTKGIINGKEVKSLMEFFRSGPYISEDYAKKSHELANFYRPFETDPKLDMKEKKKKMEEWWIKHFELLISSGLNKRHLEKMVDEIQKAGFLEFREKVFDFFKIAKEKNIPIIIISSSGLGVTIKMILEKNNQFHDNIKIITNEYTWDKKENAISVKKPIIHVFNKDETSINQFPEIYNEIKDKKNIILIGDSLGDIGMANGSNPKTLLSFGFFEEKTEDNLPTYKSAFDVVLTDNASFDEINKITEKII